MNELILYTTAILTLALIGGYIAVKFKQYAIVGYILMGVIIGSFISKIPGSENDIQTLSYIGVALLIFYTGTEFSLGKVLEYKGVIIKGIIIQFIINLLIITFLLFILKINIIQSIIISAALSFSSTIIVSKILKDLDRNYSNENQITISWLMLQDLISIPVIIFIEDFAQRVHGSMLIFSILSPILKSILLLIIIYYLGSLIIPYILKEIAKTEIRELLIISIICILFIMITLSYYIGISPVIGAFIAGLIISKGMLNHEISSEIRPFKDIFSVFFFILIGTLTPISFIFSHIIIIILLIIFFVLIKIIVEYLLLNNFHFHSLESFTIALNMFQAGEFSFIVGLTAYSYGLLSFNNYHLLLSVTIITMIFSPIVIKNNINIYNFIKRFLGKKDNRSHTSSQVESEKDSHSDIVIAGYGRVGRQITNILVKNGISVTVIDFNKDLINSEKNKNIRFVYGNAESLDILKFARVPDAKVLIITTPEIEVNYEITTLSKKINPRIKIIARSHLPKHKEILSKSGVEHVIEPEKEAAKKMTEILLQSIGKKEKEILFILDNIK
jgi:CPA2 family monovalent cation:H+ antiporter-2